MTQGAAGKSPWSTWAMTAQHTSYLSSHHRTREGDKNVLQHTRRRIGAIRTGHVPDIVF